MEQATKRRGGARAGMTAGEAAASDRAGGQGATGQSATGQSAASQEALARAAQVLRAIQMRGGEVVETRLGETRAFAALDGYGGEVERFDAAAVDALRSNGVLKVKRFERGGVVLGLCGAPSARVAYFSGD